MSLSIVCNSEWDVTEQYLDKRDMIHELWHTEPYCDFKQLVCWSVERAAQNMVAMIATVIYLHFIYEFYIQFLISYSAALNKKHPLEEIHLW